MSAGEREGRYSLTHPCCLSTSLPLRLNCTFTQMPLARPLLHCQVPLLHFRRWRLQLCILQGHLQSCFRAVPPY